MLRTIAVSGYRSLRDVAVPLGGLTVVTGANGTGKSNLYRALRLLAGAATGGMVEAVAREGGLSSLLWAGPEGGGDQGTLRRDPVAVRLGFASDELGYLVDLGLPQTDGRSLFSRDPEIKREQVFAGAVAKTSSLLIDRRRSATRVREDAWITLDQSLAPFESILVDLADGDTGPELLSLRRTLASWRFYDHFRVDADAPARSPQVGTRTRALSHGGEDIAALWASVREAGAGDALDAEVGRAFPGMRVQIDAEDGRLRMRLHQPGLLRALDVAEVSDGILRYLLLCAALLPASPGPLIVLNEPEASLHESLLAPLAELIVSASGRTQVIVVTHAAELARRLEDAGALAHRLARTSDGTVVDGQGFLDVPAWNWGSR
ncbi:AAA family ATPase [Microbacterium sp. BG28]|uniref:AAA family ATPase n=1 Tax=Microbacterium sp. BG28 TaxID=3097356 RepID=UPI002A5A7D59|nr:AAA family ATPase [Microbacterium sp. BG28]MDY0830627.1 AAA family ATPase [Microbacterium sp. BG28]